MSIDACDYAEDYNDYVDEKDLHECVLCHKLVRHIPNDRVKINSIDNYICAECNLVASRMTPNILVCLGKLERFKVPTPSSNYNNMGSCFFPISHFFYIDKDDLNINYIKYLARLLEQVKIDIKEEDKIFYTYPTEIK